MTTLGAALLISTSVGCLRCVRRSGSVSVSAIRRCDLGPALSNTRFGRGVLLAAGSHLIAFNRGVSRRDPSPCGLALNGEYYIVDTLRLRSCADMSRQVDLACSAPFDFCCHRRDACPAVFMTASQQPVTW